MIRLTKDSYKDLIDPTKPKRFPFRPGMNASADIKTKRHDDVLSIPIMSVNARVKGSDKSMADKKKEQEAKKPEDNPMSNEPVVASDELEEVIFILQKDGTVKKAIVKTGIQDINNIEVITGPYNAISEKLKDGMKVKVVPKEELFKK
jgi:HlyD family secretion protein